MVSVRRRTPKLTYIEQRHAAGKRQRPVLRVTAAANSGCYGRCYTLRADMVVQVQYIPVDHI